MAKVESKLVIPEYHNNLSGLNEGEYLHLNIAEKEKFDNLQLYLDSKLDKNNSITPGSFAKITYDAKGLVTGGSNANISDINSLQDALDLKMTGNSAITGGTYTKITYDSKGLVTGGSNATTADINDSSNKRYVVDTDLIKLGNLSGVNTGDQNLNYIASLTDGTVELSNGNDAIIPLASEFHAGLLSPGEKDLIETAVQPGQLDDIAFSGDVPWSSIVGDINLQVDLQNQFDTKFDVPNGTSEQYLDGLGVPKNFPSFATNLENLTDVLVVDKQNKDGIFYNSTSGLWENKSIEEILEFTPADESTTITINGITYDLSEDRSWTIAGGSGVRNIETFISTEGQTEFVTTGYEVNGIDVYLNGSRLQNTEFVATNGIDIVLSESTVEGDVVECIIWTVNSVSSSLTLETDNFGEEISYDNLTNTLTIDKYNWMDLVRGYTVIPSLFSSSVDFEVYQYTYSSATFYRKIKLDGTEDAFYSDSGLTNKLCDKKIIL